MTDIHATLKKRAEHLSRIEEEEKTCDDHISLVEFSLGDEKYAIESQYIQEVYPLNDVTVIPCVPSYVFGVINVRRRILSVVDLREIFGVPRSEENLKQKVIILEGDAIEFAILADSIKGMRKISPGEIQSTLPTLTGVRKEFFKGVTQDGLVILDGLKILSGKRIIVSKECSV